MKHALSVLALTAAAAVAAPAFAQSGMTTWKAIAAGALEEPPNGSPGNSLTTIDLSDTQLFVDTPFRDLTGPTVMAHIHCCTTEAFRGVAPVAVPFEGFPTGVTAGTYANAIPLYDAATYAPDFLAANGGTPQGAASALLDAIAANQAYVNIHTSRYPNGEIRGFLVAAPVPEPGEWAMLGIGLTGLMWMGRRRSRV